MMMYSYLLKISSLLIIFNLFYCSIEEKQLSLFHSSPEEEIKITKWDTGDTTISNEDRYDLFKPHIKNLQGGYLGVGSIQNYTFAAWAKSEWVWLVDFTSTVVFSHYVHFSLIKRSKTPRQFKQLWQKKYKGDVLYYIQEDYKDHPKYKNIIRSYYKAAPYLRKRFRTLNFLTKKMKYSIWLNNQRQYNHIRNLVRNKRIRALYGDLNGAITVQGIHQAAKEMDVSIKVVYFSNAEEYFRYYHNQKQRVGYSRNFKNNWISLPSNYDSKLIRTWSILKSKYPWPKHSGYSTKRGFHYNVMEFDNFKEWLSNYEHISLYKLVTLSNPHKIRHGLSIIKKRPMNYEFP